MWQTVVVNLVANSMLALVSIIIVAAVTKWAATRFTNVNEPRVAAFWLSIGYGIAKYSGSVSIGSDGLTAKEAVVLGQGVGAIAALWIVWWWLFRRSVRAEQDR